MHIWNKFRIEEFLNGEIQPGARREMENHLTDCAACRRDLLDAQKAKEYLSWLRVDEMPPVPSADFYAKVRQSIEKKEADGWLSSLAVTFRPRLVYPLAFAVLMLAAWRITLPAQAMDELFLVDAVIAQFSDLPTLDAGQLSSNEMVMQNLAGIEEIQ